MRGDDFAQVAFRLHRRLAGGFDFFVGSGASEFLGKGHGNGLGVDESARRFEIFAHALRIYLEFWRERSEVMKRSGSETNDFWKSPPLGVPRAEATLMLVRRSRENRGD